MWVVRIEEDPEDDFEECVFLVNDETGQRRREEGLGRYLDELREDPDFDEESLIETYMEEAQYFADMWNRDPSLAPKIERKTKKPAAKK